MFKVVSRESAGTGRSESLAEFILLLNCHRFPVRIVSFHPAT